jgi:hypothetical protein
MQFHKNLKKKMKFKTSKIKIILENNMSIRLIFNIQILKSLKLMEKNKIIKKLKKIQILY